jgi:hypothetical protein
MDYPEKPKRKQRKQGYLRFFLALLVLIPSLLVFNPYFETGLIGDGIAYTVMISSAVYIVYQGIAWLIRQYYA